MIATLKEYITGDFDPLDLDKLNYFEIVIFPNANGERLIIDTVQGRERALAIAIAECKQRWPLFEIEHDEFQVYQPTSLYNLAIIRKTRH